MRLLIAGFSVFVALVVDAPTARSSAGSPPAGTFSGCPRDTRPLPGPLAGFEKSLESAVLQFVRTSLPKLGTTPGRQFIGARVRFVILVRNWGPSGWIRRECGANVWRNSVAVDVYFPRLDKPHNPVGHCNACAHLTLLAALTRGGWTIWGDY